MKKKNGFSVAGIIAIIVIVAALIFLTVQIINSKNNAADYDTYTSTAIIQADETNGNIADHVKGNPDAPVVIIEYSNYQCNHCAATAPLVDKIIADSNGQLAVISRNLTMSSFQNSKAAAAAAEAAGLQGYWEPYATLLFENQAEWAYASGSERSQLFDKYFTEVSDGKGDLAKFNSDIASEAVEKKIKFDTALAEKDGVQGTPNFFYEGQLLNGSDGGEVVVEGQTLTYNTDTNFSDFIKRIIAIKTGQPDPGESTSTNTNPEASSDTSSESNE